MNDKVIQIPPPAPDPDLAYKPDDDQLAVAITAQWSTKVRYFHGQWHVYEGGYWQQRDIHEMKIGLRKQLRLYREKGVQVTQRRINSLEQMLEDDLYIADRRLMECQQETKKYINLRNGMFNLETMQLEAHRSDLYFTHQLDFDYDPGAACPVFIQYLESSLVYPDTVPDFKLIELVLQALAYSMTARTDMKASFWLLGQPDSGKSTFIAFIRSLMGSLHTTIDLNQLGNRFLLQNVPGKRVITFPEADRNSVIPDGLYKALSGGSDELYIDIKNSEPITIIPEFKLWWAMNDTPRTVDRSDAFFNRLVMIPFNRSIPQSERDPALLSKLVRERSGIFNLLLPAYERLLRAGHFIKADQSIKKLREYQAENDTEATYLAERCERVPNGRVQADPLYRDYRDWCESNGFKAKNANQAAKEWERLKLVRTESGGKRYWNGIVLCDS